MLPVRVGYDARRDKIMQVIAGSSKGDETIREVQIYPSSGKLVVGLRAAKFAETDPAAGEWVYLSVTPNVDGDKQTLQFSDLAADSSIANDISTLLGSDQLVGQLRDQASVSHAAAWQNLLNSANRRLTQPLKNGYRMEGHLTSAKLDHVLLSSDGISVALRASGDLKILYSL
jgi:hypothetical protein